MKAHLLLFVFIVATECLFGQSLKKTVEVKFDKISPEEVFKLLESKYDVLFSYNKNIFDQSGSYSFQGKPCSLHEFLTITFGANYEFIDQGKYIVIRKSSLKRGEKYIAGYIKSASGEGLKNVTVYNPKSFNSTRTDDLGYYRMKIRNGESNGQLSVAKKDYKDTLFLAEDLIDQNVLFLITKGDSSFIPFYHSKTLKRGYDRFSQNLSLALVRSRPEEENISDTLFKKVQIGFLPYLGSNRRLSGRVVNSYSLNLLGGFSFGNTHLELGGLFNINRSNMSGLQIGGLFNLVGEEVKGLQIAGLFNANSFQSQGLQIGGLMNYSKGSTHLYQIAGTVNFADSSCFQLSPFNFSRKSKVQIGVFNFANDSSVFQLGVVSFNKCGYHQLEMAYNSEQHLELSFRTGNYSLYNILLSSINPVSSDSTEWSFGYGIGTTLLSEKKLRIQLDLTSQQLLRGNNISFLHLNNRAALTVQYSIAKKTSVFIGLAYNQALYELGAPSIAFRTSNALFKDRYGSLLTEGWIGWRFGFRFL